MPPPEVIKIESAAKLFFCHFQRQLMASGISTNHVPEKEQLKFLITRSEITLKNLKSNENKFDKSQ